VGVVDAVREADYPGALWIPAHQSNFRVRARRHVQRIILHCTDGQPKAEVAAKRLQKPNLGTSFHFVVGQDGEIVQCVSIMDDAWHAHGQNPVSVSVEHACRTPGELGKDDPGLPPTEVQLEAGAKLVAWLCVALGLEPSRATIQGHAEADPLTTHRGCPTSAGIDLDAYVARVVQAWCF
jgi:N-acetyl-anhydromuramyl-L-alanine amidase AmpD